MKVAGLFAGIGGLEVGLQRAGHMATLFAENWSPAAAVLNCRFPDIPNEGDVRQLRSLPGDVELLTAGFPCQDLSQAGKTAGIEGARSGLVGQVFRLLDDRPMPWVLLENVSFMLHLDNGRAMTRLVTAFEERGYLWAYRVVNSLAFLPQRRERVFFVASRVADPADVLLVDEASPRVPETSLDSHAHGFYWTEGIRGLGWAPDAVPTIKNGSSVGIPAPPAVLLPDGTVVKPDVRDGERLQGFEAGWTKPAEQVGRASWRWSLIGNAVTVPVAQWVGSRLTSPSRHDASLDRDLANKGAWPKAARYDGRKRLAVEMGAYPVWKRRKPLHQFLKFQADLLSTRATAGFLKRTEIGTLRFVEGFRERVGRHLERMRDLDRAAATPAE
ncbi:MAG: DNA (cytosine-5-)-methyltransferase [Hyphomicrobiales bacterium]|nr:DNA (cytosine-5-)-methyltransferase [Hyphomicrobiales bacterium]